MGLAIILTALLHCIVVLGKEASQKVQLPSVPLESLESPRSNHIDFIYTTLAQVGAVAVSGVHAELAGRNVPLGEVSQTALRAWAACLRQEGEARKASVQTSLSGGAVRRLTYVLNAPGTAAPVQRCPGADANSITAVHSAIHRASNALFSALDAYAQQTNSAPLVVRKSAGSVLASSLVDALGNATHLDHLHLYEENKSKGAFTDRRGQPNESVEALNVHTDAGFMLAFVPPASAGNELDPLLVDVETIRGRQSLARPPEDSVLFFVGEASRFLGQGVPGPMKLKALPHALSLPTGFGWRMWHGTMFLFPNDARISTGSASTTFGEVWHNARAAVMANPSSVSEMACPFGIAVADQGISCPAGQMECWMTCMSTAGLTCSSPVCEDPDGKLWPKDTGNMCPTCKPTCPKAEATSTILL